MQLKELVLDYPCEVICGSLDKEIANISYNSTKVTNDSLFICIKGTKVDGHDYIESAIENGATAIVVENDISNISKNITVINVANASEALAYISVNFFGNPQSNFTLVGVTGTVGKTSVTACIKNELEKLNYTVGTIGSKGALYNNQNINVGQNTVTTPNSLELQHLFYEMKSVDYVVMEVTSHALAQHRVDYCDYKVGIFTNLSEDHLEFHKTIENYKKAKLKLFEQTESAVINNDDEFSKDIKKICNNIITYAIHNDADIVASNICYNDNNSITFTLKFFDETSSVTIDGHKEFEIYNYLAAIATIKKLIGG